MHELVGKSVEVKRATPKGTGPGGMGRGQIWRSGSFERPDQRGPLEPAAIRGQGQGWTAYGSPGGMIYAAHGYQVSRATSHLQSRLLPVKETMRAIFCNQFMSCFAASY